MDHMTLWYRAPQCLKLMFLVPYIHNQRFTETGCLLEA